MQQRLQAVGDDISTDGVYFPLIVVWCWLVTRRCVCGGGGGKGGLPIVSCYFCLRYCHVHFLYRVLYSINYPPVSATVAETTPPSGGFYFINIENAATTRFAFVLVY